MPLDVPDQIRTDRLILRRHRHDDLDSFHSFLVHPEATRFMAFTPEQKTREGARALLEYVIGYYDSDAPVFSLTIADQEDRYLGSCGLQPVEGTSTVEIYYTVVPEHQGRGIGTEATEALVEYVWTRTLFTRIVAMVVPEKVPSVRVAKKAGFVDAGAVKLEAVDGELAHAQMEGRVLVLERPVERMELEFVPEGAGQR